MQNNQIDIAIVGGGIVGLATAFQLQSKFPKLNLVVFEKECELAFHQTGRNSGVIHSGLYYKPGTFRAKNCVNGRKKLVKFAKENNIAHDVCGKIVVAVNEVESKRLEDLKQNGEQNGLVGLQLLSPEEFKTIEPNAEGVKALLVPETGIIDYKGVTNTFAKIVKEINSNSLVLTSCKVLDYQENMIQTTKGAYKSFAQQSRFAWPVYLPSLPSKCASHVISSSD